MIVHRLIACAVLVALGAPGIAATKPASKKAAAKAPAGPQRLKGKQETLACRLGTEDRHARIAVVLIGGKTDSFAYYSKWKPRTCSIYLQRWRDMYSKWEDNGQLTTVSLERGAFLIEHKKGEYHFIFRDIDRERYCGMDGVINGSLTIRKGNDQCQLEGDIMVEGTPLGEAVVNREEDNKPPAGMTPASVPSSAAQAAPAAPQKSATAAVKPSAAEQPPAPAAKAAPSAAASEPPKAEPAAATPKPEAAKEAEPAKAEAVTTTQTPPAKAASAPPADASGSAVATVKAEPQKAAESPSNPIGSFFRSLTQTRPTETPPDNH